MVAKIELKNHLTPFNALDQRAEKIGEERERGRLISTTYQLFNKFNPKIKFSILYKKSCYVTEYTVIEIKRIYC